VKGLRTDCDADAILALVEPVGPACHTGERTCFFRAFEAPDGQAE
jgi:phosphoribosyl-AMP cyclohydrolase